MKEQALIALAAILFVAPHSLAARANAAAQQQQMDYLTDAEADKIRDAYFPAQRIKLYLGFAEDRINRFEYEIHRPVPDRRRDEILNALLNGYVGCVDDAADQIAIAQEKQMDIREPLKLMVAKYKNFLDILAKYELNGPDLDVYKDNLDDAIEGTKDALADAEETRKTMPPPPVRRKQQ